MKKGFVGLMHVEAITGFLHLWNSSFSIEIVTDSEKNKHYIKI